MGWWNAWITWWRSEAEGEEVEPPPPPEVVWVQAPVSRVAPHGVRSVAREYPVPSYEDIVLLRRRLPTEPVRALEVARRAAVCDPVVRQRVLGSEAARLALCEAVELAVLERISEGRIQVRQRAS